MGYCMYQKNCYMFIDKKDFDAVIEAVKNLLKRVEEIGGGCNGSQRTFSWVDSYELQNSVSISDVFNSWRWEVGFDENGNINLFEFAGEKLGDDEILFSAIAPWVRENSYIQMQGEDDDMWRWYFTDGKMKEIHPQINWVDSLQQ